MTPFAPLAVLNIGGAGFDRQLASTGDGQHVTLAATEILSFGALVQPRWGQGRPQHSLWIFFLIRHAHCLPVSDGAEGGDVAPGALPVSQNERMVSRGPDAFSLPATQMVTDRLLWWEIVRQQSPRALGAQQVHNYRDDLSLGRLSGVASRIIGSISRHWSLVRSLG
jgi:hypothetical protein